LSETFLILRRFQRDIIINVHWSSGKVPVIPARFEIKFNFLDRFWKNTQISNFKKFRTMEAELFHADGQTDSRTDMTKLIASFHNLTNASKMITSFKRINFDEADVAPPPPRSPLVAYARRDLSNHD